MIWKTIKILWVVFVTLACLQSCDLYLYKLSNTVCASEIEVGVSADYGWPITDKVTNSTISIRVDKLVSDNFSVGLETDLSHLSFGKEYDNKDTSAISFCPMLKYDFLKLKNITFYGEGGFGVGFVNDSPSERTLGHNPLGVIKAGIGAEIPISKKAKVEVGVKYNHLSSHNPGDKGVNFGGPKFGVTWRF